MINFNVLIDSDVTCLSVLINNKIPSHNCVEKKLLVINFKSNKAALLN